MIEISTFYNYFGSTLAIILSIIKIKEHTQDQVKLSIDLEVEEFTIVAPNPDQLGYNEEHGYIRLSVIADIVNKGRQPVSISRVELSSPIDSFTNISLFTTTKSLHDVLCESYFEKVRIESNDRTYLKIYNFSINYVDIAEPIDCTISFFASHKTIYKKIGSL